MPPSPCPFCALPADRILLESPTAIAFLDGYPVTEGHTLVIPKRHIQSAFSLPPDELSSVWTVVAQVRALLIEKYQPDGFNIGVNDGAAAGQTIGHAHVHVIPRRKGDVAEPRGGIRWIVPERARYW